MYQMIRWRLCVFFCILRCLSVSPAFHYVGTELRQLKLRQRYKSLQILGQPILRPKPDLLPGIRPWTQLGNFRPQHSPYCMWSSKVLKLCSYVNELFHRHLGLYAHLPRCEGQKHVRRSHRSLGDKTPTFAGKWDRGTWFGDNSYLIYCSYHAFTLMSTPCRLNSGKLGWLICYLLLYCYSNIAIEILLSKQYFPHWPKSGGQNICPPHFQIRRGAARGQKNAFITEATVVATAITSFRPLCN